jgi:hypothetical protein
MDHVVGACARDATGSGTIGLDGDRSSIEPLFGKTMQSAIDGPAFEKYFKL